MATFCRLRKLHSQKFLSSAQLRVANVGGSGASIGETPDKMSVVGTGDVVSFLPGAPKVIKVSYVYAITNHGWLAGLTDGMDLAS